MRGLRVLSVGLGTEYMRMSFKALAAVLKKQWIAERTRCQSCGMPVIYDKKYRPGSDYCSYCHDGASFLNEGTTLRAMQDKVDALLVARRAPPLLRLYMRLRLMTLQRWRGSALSRSQGAGAVKARE